MAGCVEWAHDTLRGNITLVSPADRQDWNNYILLFASKVNWVFKDLLHQLLLLQYELTTRIDAYVFALSCPVEPRILFNTLCNLNRLIHRRKGLRRKPLGTDRDVLQHKHVNLVLPNLPALDGKWAWFGLFLY